MLLINQNNVWLSRDDPPHLVMETIEVSTAVGQTGYHQPSQHLKYMYIKYVVNSFCPITSVSSIIFLLKQKTNVWGHADKNSILNVPCETA